MVGTARQHRGYQEIADELRTRINRGEFAGSGKLPGEAELAVQFAVARDTVRRALESLTAAGLLVTVRGRGRFVAGNASEPEADYRRVADALRQRIAEGMLEPGDLLPSESEIRSEFDVSRTTARKAFKELEREGYAQSRQKGQVRIVTSPTDYHDNGDRSTAWIVHGETPIYENYWVTVAMADIQTPDGERFDHHKVYLPPAAMTAMLDDQGRVFMMWRHRFVSDTWNWELPGGVVDEGEEPAATAAREILEETGYQPISELEHVASFEPMIGTVTSPHHVFVARGVEHVAEPTEVNESQRTAWIPLEKIPELVSSGEIKNSGALIALFYLLASTPKE